MNSFSQPVQLFNEVRFERMACGDVPGFIDLAEEYFTDVRKRMMEWGALLAAGEIRRLSEDFHRCKGGAAMFGFERLYSLFGEVEDSVVELRDSHLERFASEIEAAQTAVVARRAKSSDV